MKDFLDILKRTYIMCIGFVGIFGLVFAPIILAGELECGWLAIFEIITAPLGIALGVWGLFKINEW